MYDLRNEPHEFVAEDRREAVRKACQFFEVEEEALVIAELDAGQVSGLANRTLVVAFPRDRRARRSSGPEGTSRSRPSGGGAPRESRGRDRERNRDRERDRERDGGRSRRGRARREEPDEDREARRPAPAPSEPSVGSARGELSEIGRFLLGLVERMDLGPFELAESADADMVVLEVHGAAAQELSQGSGRAVDALQLVANQAALRIDADHRRVVVDVEGDAEAREDFLTALAQRVARRARESGRAVALDPMNARDRRLIHIALRDDEDVATMSRGEGRYRQVVVVPEGAPEFEQARQEASAAASARYER